MTVKGVVQMIESIDLLIKILRNYLDAGCRDFGIYVKLSDNQRLKVVVQND